MKISHPANILLVFLALCTPQIVAADIDAELAWADVRLVSIPVDGLVTHVDVERGQRFSKGASLIRFSQKSPGFNLRKAEAAVAATASQLKDALREKNDAEVLYEQTVLSDVELQAAQLRYQQVKARHDIARAELDHARWTMGWTRIEAPYDGIVISSSVLPGQMVAGDVRSKALMKLASTSAMRAIATSGRDKLLSLKSGDAVQVEVNDRRFSAKVISKVTITEKNAIDRVRLTVEFETDMPFYAGMKASIIEP